MIYHYFFIAYFLLWTTSDNTFQRFSYAYQINISTLLVVFGDSFTYPFSIVGRSSSFLY